MKKENVECNNNDKKINNKLKKINKIICDNRWSKINIPTVWRFQWKNHLNGIHHFCLQLNNYHLTILCKDASVHVIPNRKRLAHLNRL